MEPGSDALRSTGKPIGVLRSASTFINLELLVEWRHLESGGNSGVFLWVPQQALDGLKPGVLPDWGIEIQMLDHGFAAKKYEREHGRKGDWFTTNGDVFAVGKSTLVPFPPTSAERLAQLSPEEPEQGRRRVEPLLCARHQR